MISKVLILSLVLTVACAYTRLSVAGTKFTYNHTDIFLNGVN